MHLRRSHVALPKQKALISAMSVFSYTLSDGSLEVSFYHHQSVNALFLAIFFPLPSVRLSKRLPIHVGSLEGFKLSPTKCKRCTAYHIFSLADVCGCRGVGFMLFFGFCSLLFSLHITLSQELIFIFSCHLVCDLSTASRCVSRETFQFFSLNPLSFTVVVI